MLATKTDTGTPGASDNTIPPTAATSANTTEVSMAAAGEVTTCRRAAGVISSDITSSAPTICTAWAATTPTSAANTIPSA